RIVDVNPEQEWFCRLGVKPSAGPIDDIGRRAFRSAAGHFIIVDGISLIQSEALLENGGADKCGRIPSLLSKNRRERPELPRENEPAGIAHFVSRRIQAGHYAGVGWSREGRLGNGIFE